MNGLEVVGVTGIVLACAGLVILSGWLIGKIFDNSVAIDLITESNHRHGDFVSKEIWDLKHRVDALEKGASHARE